MNEFYRSFLKPFDHDYWSGSFLTNAIHMLIWLKIFLLFNLLGVIGVERPGRVTGFIHKSVTVNHERMNYTVYVPPGYNADEEWPVVVFLHGLLMNDALTSSGLNVFATGICLGPIVMEEPELYPCLILFPQLPFAALSWEGNDRVIDYPLEQVLTEYNVDPNRVSMTGVSSGGFGTWDYVASHADAFSALVPIGSYLEDEANVDNLVNVPIWMFHGSDDLLVCVSDARRTVEALQNAGADIRYTEYPGEGHMWIWNTAYSDPEVIGWLLNQSKE